MSEPLRRTDALVDDDSDSYRVHLDQFEGPLDLLLHLVKEAKIEIKDIFVSNITEQYLAYMEDLDALDLERAAAFVSVTTMILEIKVRALLPREEETQTEADDPKARLIQMLREHELFKKASALIKPLDNVASFYKPPEPAAFNVREVLKDVTIDGLIAAFTRLLHRVELTNNPPPPRTIAKDRFTVADKINQIKDELFVVKAMWFHELFEKDYTKSEMISTFQALLELLKMQIVTTEQDRTFAPIRLTYIEQLLVEEE
ncbi:MAG: segregation/condensation protein A [Clostridiales bacterium]|jgi:segregation and condensation protein A|nr:segregation/condensation protein A [Clostridiales bacterium]